MTVDVTVATYNVEALFDCVKDGTTLDDDYLPTGYYAWTPEKLARKLENLARVIRAIDDGRGPDVLALVEVENRGVVSALRDAMPTLHFTTIAHHEGEDLHGLENAVLSRFPLAAEPVIHHLSSFGTAREWRMRGILEVHLDIHGHELVLFVNHWPAGSGRKEAQRSDAARQLRVLVDAALAKDPDAKIIVCGDFNANPSDACFGSRALGVSVDLDEGTLFHTMAFGRSPSSLAALEESLRTDAQCTHFTRPPPYDGPDGTWNVLDHIFVSRGLLREDAPLAWVRGSTAIVREDFMLAADGTPRTFFERGVKPRDQALDRTGFSDHLPVVTRLRSTS